MKGEENDGSCAGVCCVCVCVCVCVGGERLDEV